MSQAAEYSAKTLTLDSVEIVRLTDGAHRTELSICPSVGNIAYEMKVNGKPILMPPAGSLAEWKAKPSQAVENRFRLTNKARTTEPMGANADTMKFTSNRL